MIDSPHPVKTTPGIASPAPAGGSIWRRAPETMLNLERRRELPNTEKFYMVSSTFFKEVVLYDYVACPRINGIDLLTFMQEEVLR